MPKHNTRFISAVMLNGYTDARSREVELNYLVERLTKSD